MKSLKWEDISYDGMVCMRSSEVIVTRELVQRIEDSMLRPAMRPARGECKAVSLNTDRYGIGFSVCRGC
ncbi:MAG: hypothetical protein A2Y33_14675 [Spirochaetes bacterium GWF1_51_8]|nr:MAG: hypothetical protein A2Y33_14675 [Spirochaetes bacterium GWF1_51_8]